MTRAVAHADGAGQRGALPAGTWWRFALLMVTLCAGAVSVSLTFFALLVDRFPSTPLLGSRTCFSKLLTDINARQMDYGVTFNNCATRAETARDIAAVLIACLVIGLTIVIYWLYPLIISRSAQARPLATMAHSVPEAVHRLIEDRVSRSGRPVEVLVTTARLTADARAYGCFSRYRLLLDLGLMASASDGDDSRLRAVLEHEVAHIRNRDIGVTYLAMSLWWAFLLSMGPIFLFALIVAPRTAVDLISWRVLVLLATVWLARASVLRARELHADLSASTDGPVSASLARVLAANASQEDAGWTTRAIRLLSYHPGPKTRIAILADAEPLFRLWPIDCLVAGMLVGLSYSPFEEFFEKLGISFDWVDPLLGMIFGVLISGFLVTGLWRHVQQLAAGRRPAGIWRTAISFAMGIIIGQLITPPVGSVSGLATLLKREPLETIALLAVLYVLCYFLFQWIALCAGGWLMAARSPSRALLMANLIAVVVAGSWFSYWFRAQGLLLQSASPWQLLLFLGQSLSLNVYVVLGLALALAYPCAAWVRLRLQGSVGYTVEAQEGRLLPPLVPVPAAIPIAVIIALASTLLPFAFLDTLRRDIAASTADPALLAACLYVTLKIGAAAAAIGGFVVGFLGCRSRTMTPVLTSAALGAMIVAPYGAWCSILALTYVGGPAHALRMVGQVTTRYWSNVATLSGIWLTALAGACVLGALLGGAIPTLARIVRGKRTVVAGLPTRPRRATIMIVALAPAVALAAFVSSAAHGIYVVQASDSITSLGTTSAEVMREQKVITPGSVPVLTACDQVRVAQTGLSWNAFSSVDDVAVMDARTAIAAYSGNDLGLYALGASLGNAMLSNDVDRAKALANAVIIYCNEVFNTAR